MKVKTPKIKWVVDPAPTGQYRSFQKRGWPSAHYVDTEDAKICATISCEEEYKPWRIKEGKYSPLTLRVMDWSGERPIWKKVKSQFTTLQELKDTLPKVLAKFHQFVPKELS